MLKSWAKQCLRISVGQAASVEEIDKQRFGSTLLQTDSTLFFQIDSLCIEIEIEFTSIDFKDTVFFAFLL